MKRIVVILLLSFLSGISVAKAGALRLNEIDSLIQLDGDRAYVLLKALMIQAVEQENTELTMEVLKRPSHQYNSELFLSNALVDLENEKTSLTERIYLNHQSNKI